MRFMEWLLRYGMDPVDVARICASDSGVEGFPCVFVRRVGDLRRMYDRCQGEVADETQIHRPEATMRDSDCEIE